MRHTLRSLGWLREPTESSNERLRLALHQHLAVLLIGDHPSSIENLGLHGRAENILNTIDSFP